MQGQGRQPAWTRALENGWEHISYMDTKQYTPDMNDSTERPFHTTLSKPCDSLLNAFAFMLFSVQRGAVGIRDQVVNTADKLQAENRIELESHS